MNNSINMIQKAMEFVEENETDSRIKNIILTKLEEAILWAQKMNE